jgi:RNA polymerase primary sigma factor
MVGLLTRRRRAERALRRELGRDLGEWGGRRPARLESGPARHGRPRAAGPPPLPGIDRDDAHARSSETAPDPGGSPGTTLENDEERRAVLGRLDGLEARERDVLTMRFGLEGQPALTLKEVGRRLGVIHEWVRKLQARALQRLSTVEWVEGELARRVRERIGGALPTWGEVLEEARSLGCRKDAGESSDV